LALIEKHPGVLVQAHKFKDHQQGNYQIGGIGGGIEITHLVARCHTATVVVGQRWSLDWLMTHLFL
jgi:hypothetical protein